MLTPTLMLTALSDGDDAEANHTTLDRLKTQGWPTYLQNAVRV